jgi:hypothetical protein
MTSRTVRLPALIAAVGFWSAALALAWAEGGDPGALAAAMKGAMVTLQGGLETSEREGMPISAKFEIEDGKLQLSVYTMKVDEFMEVVVDPKSEKIEKAGKITDADDLKTATSQKTAMTKAMVSLFTATTSAVKANNGFRAVQRLRAAARQQSRGRGDPPARNDAQESDRKARLSPA